MKQASAAPGQVMIGWWQRGMAGSRPPRGLRAAIDLTATTGFEPILAETLATSDLKIRKCQAGHIYQTAPRSDKLRA